MSARDWQPGDRALIEVEVIERYSDTHFDVQVSTGGASWLMNVAASSLRPVPAAGEAATEDVIEQAARVLSEHGHSGTVNSREGVIICLCGERLPVTFDDPCMGYADADEEEAVISTHRARALAAAGLLSGGVPGRSEAEVKAEALREAADWLPSATVVGGVPGRSEVEVEWGVAYRQGDGTLFVDDDVVSREDAELRIGGDVYDFVVCRTVGPWRAARLAGTTEAGDE